MGFLKSVLPWHARKTLAFARNAYARRKPPFTGVYSSFSDITRSVGYDDPTWSKTSFDAATKARQQIGSPLPNLSPSKWLLPLLIAAMPREPVRVLDFGGASGLDYANASAALGAEPNVIYHVVDMQGACEAGREVWRDRPNVTFSTDLPTGHFDLVYAYSAIHCVDDWRSVLIRIAGYAPQFILLCKHPIHLGETFARSQVNMGKGLELAQWALSFSEIEATMKECGYRLSFRVLGEDDYNVDNFDEAHKVDRTVNLVFSRDTY